MLPKDAPKTGAKGFSLSVLPTRDALDKAIADDGFCDPRKCWHRVAIMALIMIWEPNGDPRVRVDAGHIKVNYRGWRYIADTPRHVKRSLMLFDLHRYDEVYIRQYTLRFRRTTKIVPESKERRDRINANRLARAAAGKPDRKYADLHKRVVGFSSIV
jgi:hypothetical protein